MADRTARNGLALLVAGQGQKEITHNEAVQMIDLLLHPAVVSRGVASPPETPLAGACWLVATGATGSWAGESGRLACWTEGGWRFADLGEGTVLWVGDEGGFLRRATNSWVPLLPAGAPLAGVQNPVGGSVIDVEARAAIVVLADRLRSLGLVSG